MMKMDFNSKLYNGAEGILVYNCGKNGKSCRSKKQFECSEEGYRQAKAYIAEQKKGEWVVSIMLAGCDREKPEARPGLQDCA